MEIDRIEPTKTAMIVVDMQNDFVAPGGGLETPAARAMVPLLAEALRICRSAGIKVIYTTHAHRRDGSDMGLFDSIHRLPIEVQRSMALGASRYTRRSPPLPASTSSRSIATAASLAPISTSFCGDGASIRSSSQAQPPRTAATQPPATPCSATIESCSYRTPRPRTIILIAGLDRCPTSRCITQCW